MTTVQLELSEEQAQCLRVLGGEVKALLELVERVEDGVTRPGSWERGWLCQAFGEAWTLEMSPDPLASWREVPPP